MIHGNRSFFYSAAVLVAIVAALVIAGTAAGGSAAPTESAVRVESSPQLFATMSALHAAGYRVNVSSADFYPLRIGLREQLLEMKGPAVEAIRQFYRDHLLGDPAETLSRYVSFALVVGPPPRFNDVLPRPQLPPDVLTLEGFGDLLANFYAEQQLDRMWAKLAPEYELELGRLRGPVSEMVAVSAGYLRELIPSTNPRTFTAYVEPLVGDTTNFRIYGTQYSIVISPGPKVPMGRIRHAFLHFLLDPLPQRYQAQVSSKQMLLDYAARAPRLAEEDRDNFANLLTECLVRAVDLRLSRPSPARLDAELDQSDRDGYVLVRPLYEQLHKFELAQMPMNRFFPDLVKGIDVAAEARRLQGVHFAAVEPAPSQLGGQATTAGAEASELEQWLEEGNRQIAAQNAVAATATFERILEKYPSTPRAVYGLAVSSVLAGKAERARQLFEQLVAGSPAGKGSEASAPPAAKDPVVLAWSHIYLGRMEDLDGNRELALSEYHAALAVEGAPESARLAAQRGIEKGYTLPPKNRGAGQPHP